MNRTRSSTLIAALALLVLLGVALAAGCTTTTSTTTTKGTPGATPTPAGTAAGTAAAVTTSGSSSSGSGAASVVSADRLVPFIPKAVGAWKIDGEAQKLTMQGGQGQDFTQVMGEYTKDGDDKASANIMIYDAAFAQNYRDMWSAMRTVETNDGWWKSVTVKGQPSWKSYSKDSNGYVQWVLAGDRYLVITTVDDGTEADLDALVNAMDLAGLAAVK